MNKKYLYFIAYYYLYIFKGGYPLTKNNNDVLLNHFIRTYLNIKSTEFEIDLINLMRHNKKQTIKDRAYHEFKQLKQRSNSEDRILFIANTLAYIKREANKPIERPAYLSPEHYKFQTGKQFRMTADQIERGLSREDAFNEFVKGLE